MTPTSYIIRKIRNSEKFPLSESQARILIDCLPASSKEKNAETFIDGVSVALGLHLAHCDALAHSDLKSWRSKLLRAKKDADKLLKSVDGIVSDQLLSSFLSELGETAGAEFRGEDGLLEYSRAIRTKDEWKLALSPEITFGRLRDLLWIVDRALEELPHHKHRPRDILSRSFVRRLAYQWTVATAKPPPATKPTSTAKAGGPFARFVSAANIMLPSEARISNVPGWCARVAQDDKRIWNSLFRQ